MPTLKDYFQLHFIVFLWGFTAILGLFISIPAVELVFFRTLLATGLLALIVIYQQKDFRVGRNDFIKMLLTGGLIAAHWILFFAAARVANASICLAGMATGSLWTSILEPVMRGRKISLLEIFLGLVVIAGLYVVFHFEFNHALGITMAVASALIAALFTVINAQFSERHDSYIITFYEMVGACISTALFFPIYQHSLATNQTLQLIPSAADWIFIAVLAFVCTVYAYSLAVRLMKKFSAFAMNLTVNMEPVYGIILAFLIFGKSEQMTMGFYLGTLIILAAVLLYPILNRYFSLLKFKRVPR